MIHRDEIEQVRRDILEQAAVLCLTIPPSSEIRQSTPTYRSVEWEAWMKGCEDCAAAIRSMK